MVCCNKYDRNMAGKTENSPAKGIIRKLICKARSRKSVAENYYVYALLQSTICRLEVDSHLVDRCTRTFSASSFENKSIDGDNVEVSSDPLGLNSFFVQLKRFLWKSGVCTMFAVMNINWLITELILVHRIHSCVVLFFSFILLPAIITGVWIGRRHDIPGCIF